MNTTVPARLLNMARLMETQNPANDRCGAPWLHVVSHVDPKYGGITAAVPELGSALAAAGIPIRSAAFCGPEETAGPLWSKPPERYPAGRLRWVTDSVLKRRFRQELAAVQGVHIHGLWESHCAIAASICRSIGKTYIVSAHGMLEPWALRNKAVKKRLYAALLENRNLAGAACLHALTEAEVEDYRRAGLRNPVAVIPNGIHLPGTISPNIFLKEFPSLAGRRLVVFLSRIHFKKGLDILAEAWSGVQSGFPDAHLVLAGPDFEKTRESIERRVRELGIGHRVTFTGMLNGDLKWSALAAAEVYVLPSYSEGFSVAVLEAMAMGKPVIVTQQCNIPEAAEVGCGWQIQPTSQDLQRALTEALSRPSNDLAGMGARGRDLVSRRFTWQLCGDRMASVYRWVAGGERPDCVRVAR